MMPSSFVENIAYRKLKPHESLQYRALRLESLQKHPSSFASTFEEQKQIPKLAFEKFIEESNSEAFIIGAFDQHKLIGICGFFRHKEKKSRHSAEIIQMYVQQAHQGQQVGYHLLKATLTAGFQLEALSQIELEVFANLKAANQLYEKVGFKEKRANKTTDHAESSNSNLRLMIIYRD